jgi:hypothetical protein
VPVTGKCPRGVSAGGCRSTVQASKESAAGTQQQQQLQQQQRPVAPDVYLNTNTAINRLSSHEGPCQLAGVRMTRVFGGQTGPYPSLQHFPSSLLTWKLAPNLLLVFRNPYSPHPHSLERSSLRGLWQLFAGQNGPLIASVHPKRCYGRLGAGVCSPQVRHSHLPPGSQQLSPFRCFCRSDPLAEPLRMFICMSCIMFCATGPPPGIFTSSNSTQQQNGGKQLSRGSKQRTAAQKASVKHGKRLPSNEEFKPSQQLHQEWRQGR